MKKVNKKKKKNNNYCKTKEGRELNLYFRLSFFFSCVDKIVFFFFFVLLSFSFFPLILYCFPSFVFGIATK